MNNILQYIQIKAYLITLVLLSAIVVSSCNDFLDEAPDNRTEMNSEEKVRLLLVSAYPARVSAYIAEITSDNADESEGSAWDYEQVQREMYEWRDITANDNDSPREIWEETYRAIASANLALETIESLGNPESLNPQKGEALICRAYGHFCLVNLFSMAYGANSSSDPGIPYATFSETTVRPDYDRETVETTYQKINRDIEAALPLIDDNSYSIPKYHFNKRAAYAFAARFNLYYQRWSKAVEYANVILGSNPSAMLRDWAYAGTLTVNDNVQPNLFINETNKATLMIQSTISYWPVIHGPFGVGRKYGHNETLYYTETLAANNPWGNMLNILHYGIFSNPAVNRIIMRKLGYYFEYSDPVAGIGLPHMIYPAFTTDETLLCRAEAHAMMGNFNASLYDMNAFMTAFTSGGAVTRDQINTFFNGLNFYTPTQPTIKKRINPDFTVSSGDQENLIYCVLHLRRLLTIHEGLRLFDQKRYGIDMYRRILRVDGNFTVTDTMDKNDQRRAIQLPQEVIDAGLAANPRNNTVD